MQKPLPNFISDEAAQRRHLVAEKIVRLGMDEITANLRFLDGALHRLSPASSERLRFGTDGMRLYFEPEAVIEDYRADMNAVNRAVLHTLLHAVLCHHLTGSGVDKVRWDLACDLTAERQIDALGLPAFRLREEIDEPELLKQIEAECAELTAENVYHWLMAQELSEGELSELRRCFQRDSHELWYHDEQKKDPGENEDEDDDDDTEEEEQERQKDWMHDEEKLVRGLKDASKGEAPALIQGVEKIDRQVFEYNGFLLRFGRPQEELKLSEEEYDNAYYCFGLTTYGNLPLIEPLEYRDEQRIRDFVIAIDTSGSVRGEPVQRFVQHTHDLLCVANTFDTRLNLHLLQCDNEIREAVTIHSREELEEYLDTMEIKGLGSTDFRPVFRWVEEQIREGGITNLGGLIYFTDGFGLYPERAPAFKTAFILCDSATGERRRLPPWALELALSEKSILEFKK